MGVKGRILINSCLTFTNQRASTQLIKLTFKLIRINIYLLGHLHVFSKHVLL